MGGRDVEEDAEGLSEVASLGNDGLLLEFDCWCVLLLINSLSLPSDSCFGETPFDNGTTALDARTTSSATSRPLFFIFQHLLSSSRPFYSFCAGPRASLSSAPSPIEAPHTPRLPRSLPLSLETLSSFPAFMHRDYNRTDRAVVGETSSGSSQFLFGLRHRNPPPPF